MKITPGKIAVVTGAASGIGRALAEVLAERGCHLALVDVGEPGLLETAGLCERHGARTSLHVVDVSSRERMERLPADVLGEHGAVNLVVNNAGVGVAGTFAEQTLEDMEWLMGVNFWGVVYGCKFFLPHLLTQPAAHIVNVSSIFGVVGVPMSSSYCASKFAVRGLTESLREELSNTSVGVTCVHPGGVATNIASAARYHGEQRQATRERAVHLFSKMLAPREAALAIVRGVERGQARVLITREAHVLDGLKRLAPTATQFLIGKGWERFTRDR